MGKITWVEIVILKVVQSVMMALKRTHNYKDHSVQLKCNTWHWKGLFEGDYIFYYFLSSA